MELGSAELVRLFKEINSSISAKPFIEAIYQYLKVTHTSRWKYLLKGPVEFKAFVQLFESKGGMIVGLEDFEGRQKTQLFEQKMQIVFTRDSQENTFLIGVMIKLYEFGRLHTDIHAMFGSFMTRQYAKLKTQNASWKMPLSKQFCSEFVSLRRDRRDAMLQKAIEYLETAKYDCNTNFEENIEHFKSVVAKEKST